MRISGDKKLIKQLKDLPDSVREKIAKTVRKATEDTARIARILVPVDTGELKEWIYTQYDNNGLTGSIEAAPPRKEPQIKAKAVEGGRKKGDRGTTTPNHYMNTARAFMAKKFTNRVKAAIKKAAREATNV
jgi:hypothetical protein